MTILHHHYTLCKLQCTFYEEHDKTPQCLIKMMRKKNHKKNSQVKQL